jgi:tetratricopeptide (TPR) repeat protein
MTITGFLTRAYYTTRSSRAEALYQEGMRLAGAGHSAQAADRFRAALVYEHNSEKYRLALARSLMDLGRWDEAETHLSELSEDDPTNGPINLMLARIAGQAHRDSDAVLYYQRAIYGYWPEHPIENRTSARFELIGIFKRDGQPRQVLAELLDLAAEVPEDDAATRRRIATLLLTNGSPDHAAEIYRAVLANDRSDGAAEKGLGDALFDESDFVGARNAYRAASRDGLEDPTIEDRLKECNTVLQLDPTLVRLSANERFDRARQLLDLTSAAARQCTALPADTDAAAQKLMQEKPSRRRDGDTVEMITLAQQVWKLRHDACAQPAAPDEALTAVMAKIQKQMAATQ